MSRGRKNVLECLVVVVVVVMFQIGVEVDEDDDGGGGYGGGYSDEVRDWGLYIMLYCVMLCCIVLYIYMCVCVLDAIDVY